MTIPRWWHYTLFATVTQIIASGMIRRAHSNVTMGERQAVWFSCRETWEPTATKGLLNARTGDRRPATVQEMVYAGGALARIEVAEATAQYTWRAHRQIGQVDARIADALESGARTDGADPEQWRVTYRDVPVESILSVDASEDGIDWRPMIWRDDRGVLVGDRRFIDSAEAALRQRSEAEP